MSKQGMKAMKNKRDLEQAMGKKYDPNLTVEPLVIKKGSAKEVETETLFILEDDEGNQTEYGIPVSVRPNIAIKYLNDLRTEGGELAMANALAALLGDETMTVMAESEDIGDDEMTQIFAVVQNKMLGAMEKMQGNS